MVPAVWSHRLLMAAAWSRLAGLVAARFGRGTRTGVVLDSSFSVTDRVRPMAIRDTTTVVPYPEETLRSSCIATTFGVSAGEYGTLAFGNCPLHPCAKNPRADTVPAGPA